MTDRLLLLDKFISVSIITSVISDSKLSLVSVIMDSALSQNAHQLTTTDNNVFMNRNVVLSEVPIRLLNNVHVDDC